MNLYHALKGWNKDRDAARRSEAESLLKRCDVRYSTPSPGCYKIETLKCLTLMFYPKSGKLIWQTHKKAKQQSFTSSDVGQLIRKIKELS